MSFSFPSNFVAYSLLKNGATWLYVRGGEWAARDILRNLRIYGLSNEVNPDDDIDIIRTENGKSETIFSCCGWSCCDA